MLKYEAEAADRVFHALADANRRVVIELPTRAAVFAAWSDRDTKAKWFAVEDGRYSLDFRVGGTEAVHGGDGVDLVARSDYHDWLDALGRQVAQR